MKSTQGIVAGAAAALLIVAAPVIGADQQRVRTNSDVTASNGGHDAANGAPKSFSQYMQLLKSGGNLTGGPALQRVAGNKDQSPKVIRGGGNDNHPRTPLPCGTYDDATVFETEQGPFDRTLGNQEDFENTNGNPGGFCIINSPEFVDCGSSGADPSGICATAVTAGDILNGIKLDSTPARGSGWWEQLTVGVGFLGAPSKYALPNYFGDAAVLTFPNSAVPTGCENLSPGPNVVGFDAKNPFGASGNTLIVTLADGTVVELNSGETSGGAVDDAGFIGICCGSEILSISSTDDDGTTTGIDQVRWGQNVGPCPVSFPPITLDDIHEGLEILELKLDNIDCSGSGGGSNS